MKAEDRRQQILQLLRNADEAVSASSLAAEVGVSRQIIVGDIALIRALGNDILSTPRGYILVGKDRHDSRITRQIVCSHNSEQMVQELQICVDQGCTVLDVIVDHPIYGQITGQLMLESRYDIDQFVEKTTQADARPLSILTDGIHIHTLSCPSQAAFERVCQKLKEAGIQYK